ncbi:hypothetical protein R6Q57_016988 [Mikania cordata]
MHTAGPKSFARIRDEMIDKKISCGDTTCTFLGGLMESFNASFEGQKHELLEMRKELDEEHERKKTELEAIQLDIKNQQEHLEATMRKLM